MDTTGMYNAFGNYNIPQGTGSQYYGFQTQPTMRKNVLTNEEIQSLMKQENNFSLSISDTDALRANCNHRMADGIHDSLYEDGDGFVTCSICGYKFRPLSAQTSLEDIQAATDTIVDVLQTIKLLWVNINGEAARTYFPCIPMIEKIPKLFEIAVKDFNKNGNVNPWGYNNRNMDTVNLFNMLSGMMNGVQPMGVPQQPMMGQPQPPFGGGYAMPGQAMNPVFSNGFGYIPNPSMPGYQPTNDVNGFQTQYGAPQVPPVVNATAQEIPTNTTANVAPEATTVKA